MSPRFLASVRTVVQAGIAAVVAWAANKGFNVGEEMVELATLLIVGGVTYGLNVAGDRWPIINRIVSLGLSTESPTYEKR